jgi:hypothetical protein
LEKSSQNSSEEQHRPTANFNFQSGLEDYNNTDNIQSSSLG